MRYNQSAGDYLQSLANEAPAGMQIISRDLDVGDHVNRLHYGYQRFLLEALDARMHAELYLPWEKVEKFEALRVHLAVTHHWRIEDVQLMKEGELVELLRPELMSLQLDPGDVQSILGMLGDLNVPMIREDLQARTLKS
ncbi:hypothetical protein QJS63_18230 [Pseudomonas juntendi]|nr:hypothetical protein QJS63_18230 [Pseudomonas juntendi]